MKIERRAETRWEGNLINGRGQLQLGSGAVNTLPVTWASRTERSDGRTSPEELIAGAHASCFAMAFSHTLTKEGHPPESLTVNAICTLEQVEGGWKITTMTLNVRGKVPGLDEASFVQTAHRAEKGCPVSNVLREGLRIQLNAHLEK
jgi:osmotically inducible protein OsmC